MKTLKKTLCLVLAMVMLFGLCAISASADLEYTDADEVNYPEQIEVLTEIGVLEGYEDNTFLPTKAVSREEAAKIIAYLVIGDAKQADALTTTSAPFTDVSKDRWSAGYIAYCVEKGIINGMGDGTFNPTGEVTGLQFAKMLLCALGYGVNGEYIGSSWAINTSKDGLAYGIFDDNLAGATNEAATREECGLYAFNALWLNKVSYSTLLGDYIAWTMNSWNTGSGNQLATFAADYKLEREENVVRTDGLYDVYRVNGKKLVEFKCTPTYVYTSTVKNNALLKDLGETKAVKTEGYYTNQFDAVVLTIPRNNSKNATGTGNGVLTEIYAVDEWIWDGYAYDSDEVTYFAYQTEYWLAKIASTPKENKDGDYEAKVTVYEPDGDTYKETSIGTQVVGEDYEKDDIVIVTLDLSESNDEVGTDSEIETITAPEVVEGQTVDRYDNDDDTVTYGDTEYKYSQNECYKISTDYSDTATYDFYFDQYGYVIGAVESTAAALNYVYVAKVDSTANDTTLITKDDYAAAQVYNANGEKLVVELALYTAKSSDTSKTDAANNNLVKGDKYIRIADANKDTNGKTTYTYYALADVENDENNDQYIVGELYSYTVNESGEYTLSRVLVDGKKGAVLLKGGDATASSVDVDDSAYLKVDNKKYTDHYSVKSTVLTVVDDTTTTYTGYPAYPDATFDDDETVVWIVYNSKTIKNIVVIGEDAGETDVVYGVYTGKWYSNTKTEYSYFMVDGEKIAYPVDHDELDVKGTIYQITLSTDDDGNTEAQANEIAETTGSNGKKVTTLTDIEKNVNAEVKATVDKIYKGTDGYILSDDTAYYFTDDTFYAQVFDEDGDYSYDADVEPDEGDVVTIIYSTDGGEEPYEIIAVFITEKADD